MEGERLVYRKAEGCLLFGIRLLEGVMPGLTSLNSRRGITVLALLLLIIAFVIAAIFLFPYLRST